MTSSSPASAEPRHHFRLLPDDRGLGWGPYAWLVYLAIFLARPLFASRGWVEPVLTLAATAVFLVLYFRGFWLHGRRLLPIVAAITALGVVSIPFNPGGSVFFVYAAAFVGALGRPAIAVRWLLAILAVLAAETLLLGLPPHAWIPAALFSIVVGGPNIHFIDSERANARLRQARDEVEHLAKVAERERIARDLHDLLGHTLSVIVLKSELASKLAERDPARAVREIREVETISRDALAEVRRAVQGYRSRGLEAELATGRLALKAAEVELDAEMAPVRLPPAAEGVLALAMREAITNVARHSGARRCRVRLEVLDHSVSLEVTDDGRGGRAEDGAGLAGMRERVLALGGTMERDGTRGTRILVSLPFEPAAEAAPAVPAR